MIRFALRSLGLWVLAAAFVCIVVDGTKSIAGNSILITKLGKAWSDISPATLQALRPTLDRHVPDWVGNFVTQTLLNQPTFLVLGVVGAVLILLGRKKKPLIGYGRD
jgi:hypothetical protein